MSFVPYQVSASVSGHSNSKRIIKHSIWCTFVETGNVNRRKKGKFHWEICILDRYSLYVSFISMFFVSPATHSWKKSWKRKDKLKHFSNYGWNMSLSESRIIKSLLEYYSVVNNQEKGKEKLWKGKENCWLFPWNLRQLRRK